LVNAGALVFVAYSLAQSTWRIAQPDRPVARGAAAALAPQAEFDGRALQAASLFGAFSAPATQRADQALPRATINLVLTGVAMRGAKSYALISGEGRPETAYGIGEQIVPGVVLEAVYTDRVVIVQGGARQSLFLKELAAALPTGAPASGVPAGASALSTGPGGSVLDRQAVKRLLQRPDFLSQALIVPNAGGGFRVGQVQAGSLYEKLGLRVGDVIRSVNGQPVNNMEEVMGLYQQLGNASEVNVEVLRAGVAQSLHVTLR
jgi:general secretion pathway protein C